VLAWRLSNSMDVSFCSEALDEALARFGKPEIFNTDQGSQFTSTAFTRRLEMAQIQISMDGRGRWLDNVFIERLWRSLKYEEVYLKAYADGREARVGISAWISFYKPASQHPSVYVAERRRFS
jgi:putative transposase